MSKLQQTPSQTVGPYFAYGLTSEQYGYDLKSLFTPVLVQPKAQGEHIRVYGQVYDGAGQTIGDAMIEIAHADANGQPITTTAEADAKGFTGFGRCGTGTLADHHFAFNTVKPGSVAAGEAPYISVIVTMRGLPVHAFTRIYFSDEEAANAADPVLSALPAERRATLVATREVTGAGAAYRFDIHMQSSAHGAETVFFDL